MKPNVSKMLLSLKMQFREATIHDVAEIQRVRNSVKENVLSDPNLVTDADCITYITHRGKGWVCQMDGRIIGFAIADLQDNNIWALFLEPAFEGKGIGKRLHQIMLDWYFSQTDSDVWLSTEPHSRAETFYRKAGWKDAGIYGKGEIKFELTKEQWQRQSHSA
jgi:GNAT superfamily N-acetyltransferase